MADRGYKERKEEEEVEKERKALARGDRQKKTALSFVFLFLSPRRLFFSFARDRETHRYGEPERRC